TDPLADPEEAMHEYGVALQRWEDLPRADAIRQEMELAAEARRIEAQAGAARFAGGAGRHGRVGES
ncbi:MAG: hypothetical protein ACK4QW_06955, partial [Alphaproteobacteria bacterium]